MKKNLDIIKAWDKGQEARNENLSTDGDRLYSYRLCIGRSDEEGNKIIFDYTSGGGAFASQTTSTHVGLAKRNTEAEIMRPHVADNAGLI